MRYSFQSLFWLIFNKYYLSKILVEKLITTHCLVMTMPVFISYISYQAFSWFWVIQLIHIYGIVLGHLTHWGRVTHICVGELTIIGSDNGLSPGRRQAIIWTNAGLLLIGPIETNFSEILIEILAFSFKKMRLKVSSAKRRSLCLGLNVKI